MTEETYEEQLQELKATFDYYKRQSKICMEQCQKLLEEAGRYEAAAESLRPRINELIVLRQRAMG